MGVLSEKENQGTKQDIIPSGKKRREIGRKNIMPGKERNGSTNSVEY